MNYGYRHFEKGFILGRFLGMSTAFLVFGLCSADIGHTYDNRFAATMLSTSGTRLLHQNMYQKQGSSLKSIDLYQDFWYEVKNISSYKVFMYGVKRNIGSFNGFTNKNTIKFAEGAYKSKKNLGANFRLMTIETCTAIMMGTITSLGILHVVGPPPPKDYSGIKGLLRVFMFEIQEKPTTVGTACICGYALGTAVGVWLAGKVMNKKGSFRHSLTGSIMGLMLEAGISVLGNLIAKEDTNWVAIPALVSITIGSPLGATIYYNRSINK